MKVVSKVPILLGILLFVPGFAGLAESPKHREITVWRSSPTGSLIGSGYASTYLTNIRAKTTRHDQAKLRQAIDALDGLGMIEVRGVGLLPAAVAWQSQTTMRQVIAEQAETGLSYGELLMAHTLAIESKRDLPQIVALRRGTGNWGELARQLGVSSETIVLRANLASDRIRAVDTKSRQPGPGDVSLTQSRPNLHHYSLLH